MQDRNRGSPRRTTLDLRIGKSQREVKEATGRIETHLEGDDGHTEKSEHEEGEGILSSNESEERNSERRCQEVSQSLIVNRRWEM